MGLSVKISCFFFFRILISKQIAVASLFSFPLRSKTPFRKNITDDFLFIFTEVECMGNIQIIHMEETEISQRAIGLIALVPTAVELDWQLEFSLLNDLILSCHSSYV